MNCGSSEPGAWAAYLGPGGHTALLERLLGAGTESRAGAGWGLSVRNGVGEAARLTQAPGTLARAQIGTDGDAFSSATVSEGGALTLACDPFGLHGVSYARLGGTLWAASDPRLLRRLPDVSGDLSLAAQHGYLCFSHVPTPLTMTANVSSLPAGHRLTVSAQGIVEEASEADWRERASSPLGEDALAGELRGLLRAAVARRLGAERDVAVFLSGGLDSSLVAALLAEAGARAHLFTLDFGPPFDAELASARLVAAHLGRPLRVVPARPAQIKAALAPAAAALHQPFGDGVVVPLYLLGQAARAEGLTTVFNGEGGDQLFGGWANKPMIAAELYRASGGDAAQEREAAFLATYHRFWGLTDHLYTAKGRAATAGQDAGAWVRPALEADGLPSLLHRLRAANLRLKGAQNIAPRAVQLGAAFGLRVQMPFFDRALAEWTFGLPPDWFGRGACEKHGLKQTAEFFLPPEIVWREKRGMGVPTTDWCLGPLRRVLAARLSPRRLAQSGGWLDPAAVARLRRGEDHAAEFRRRRVGEKLWSLLMLQVWRESLL